MPRDVILPPNLCAEKKLEGRSVYYRDYCSRYQTRSATYKPMNSYKPWMTENAVSTRIISDHCSKILLDYSSKDFNDTISEINTDKSINKSSNTISRTLSEIEKALIGEVDASKRQRGIKYGLAGKNVNLQHKKSVKQSSSEKVLPGFYNWLNTANEFEKEAVHNCISKVSTSELTDINDETKLCKRDTESLYQQISPRTNSSLNREAPLCENFVAPVEEKLTLTKVRFKSPPKTAPSLLTKRIVHEREIWSPPIDYTADDISVMSYVKSIKAEDVVSDQKDVFTQVPYGRTSQPSSPSYGIQEVTTNKRQQRSVSSRSSIKHSCLNCQACKKTLKDRILTDMDKQNHVKYPTAPSPPISQPIMIEDYMHSGTSFYNVCRHLKGYFVIHPDFVSEAASRAAIQRRARKDQKFFGESKSSAAVY